MVPKQTESVEKDEVVLNRDEAVTLLCGMRSALHNDAATLRKRSRTLSTSVTIADRAMMRAKANLLDRHSAAIQTGLDALNQVET